MNILKYLSALSINARQEVIPEIDVRKQVMAQISQPTENFDDMLFTYILRLWVALSGVATIAAIVISIFALQSWINWSAPLAGLLRNAGAIM